MFGFLKRLRFGQRAASPNGPAEPTAEQLTQFWSFLKLDEQALGGALRSYGAAVSGRFAECSLRIVAKEWEEGLLVEVATYDVTTLPAEPASGEYALLRQLMTEGRIQRESAWASKAAADRFRSTLGQHDWFTVANGTEQGLDGYTFTGAVRRGDGVTHTFTAWSPHGEPSLHFRFLRALHRLASESVENWRTLAALDGLLPSVGLGQVHRDFGGSPRHVRLVSAHLPDDLPALELALQSLEALPREPFVLELQATAPPVVRQWLEPRLEVAVVVRPRFREQLATFLPRHRLFVSVSEAMVALGAPAKP